MRKAFEVEDINTRQNFTFRLDVEKNTVQMLDSSLPHRSSKSGELLYEFPTDKSPPHFPFGCKDAQEYFDFIYGKAVNGDPDHPGVYFLGWVDPETLQPLEPEEETE